MSISDYFSNSNRFAKHIIFTLETYHCENKYKKFRLLFEHFASRPPILHTENAFSFHAFRFLKCETTKRPNKQRMNERTNEIIKKHNQITFYYIQSGTEINAIVIIEQQNASLFTHFAISYTLKRIPITAYQSLISHAVFCYLCVRHDDRVANKL